MSWKLGIQASTWERRKHVVVTPASLLTRFSCCRYFVKRRAWTSYSFPSRCSLQNSQQKIKLSGRFVWPRFVLGCPSWLKPLHKVETCLCLPEDALLARRGSNCGSPKVSVANGFCLILTQIDTVDKPSWAFLWDSPYVVNVGWNIDIAMVLPSKISHN